MSGVGLGHIVKLGSGPWSPSFKICKLYEKGLELMLLLKYTHPHCSGLNFSFPLPNIGQIVFFHAKNKNAPKIILLCNTLKYTVA